VDSRRNALVIGLIVLLIGKVCTGADNREERLGEPITRMTHDQLETVGTAKETRAVAVDTWSRSEVASFYYNEHVPALGIPMQWSGDAATCDAGTTSQAYLDATFRMINYYRGMVGLPAASNAAGFNADAQQAALMMSVNGTLNHYPPSNWLCWTAGGASAAGASNLALYNAGPSAIAAYIKDYGTGNHFVGHRRWILYPIRNEFGTGSVGETTRGANALVVFTNTVARPPTPDKVAWPPEGHVPYQVVYPRWSMSLNTNASVSFASADVTMTEGGNPVPLSVVSRTDYGYGDITIVWEPSPLGFAAGMGDRRFTVTVSGISGPQTTVSYDVVVMDPATVSDVIFADGFNSGTTGLWSSTVQ
jgi:hypothetical protein